MGIKLSPNRNTGGMQPPPAKGPFFIFLLMMPAFLVLIVLLLIVMQYKQLRSFVSPQPMAMVSVPHLPEAEERARARIADFLTAASRPGSSVSAAETLVVTGEDITHLSRSSRTLSEMKLDYHLEFQDTVLVARNSLPVDHLKGFMSTMARLLRVKGYLNSEMKGYPEFKDGELILVPVSAVMNGQSAPVSVLGSKGKLDVRSWVSDTEAYDKAIATLAAITIRDGRLLLVRKP